jgi:hypothetical protein
MGLPLMLLFVKERNLGTCPDIEFNNSHYISIHSLGLGLGVRQAAGTSAWCQVTCKMPRQMAADN